MAEHSEDHPVVSLTTDIGEGFGRWTIADDDALLEIVTSANVACGFHAGDPNIMRQTCQRSVDNGVSIGAQFSYRDLAGFGRRYIAVDHETLTNDLVYQAGALEAFANIAGGSVAYCRAHGALYTQSAVDPIHAAAIVEAVRLFNPKLPLLCQMGTEPWKHAKKAGIATVAEAFVDRAYTPDGLLLSRSEPNAMFTNPDKAAERAVRMVFEGKLTAIDGTDIDIEAKGLLVHSDSNNAVEVAQATRDALVSAGAELVPLT